MQLLLDGWEERAERISKRRRLAKTAGRADAPKRKHAFKQPSVEAHLERFFSRLSGPSERGCREWLLVKMPFGHGICNIANRNWLTHRVAWIIANGAIPEGMEVCHHCDNPPCCNAEHLFLGSHLDNMRDCKLKGRNTWTPRPGETNNLAKLTEEDVREIRALAGSMTYKEIASLFGVTRANVGFIINRKTWSHIT